MKEQQIHIDWLDSLRGFAVLFVLAYHCLFWTFPSTHLPWNGHFRDLRQPVDFLVLIPVTFGWSGVAVFFVVSGFCIHLSFSRRNEFKHFYWKRFWRIFPPYFVAMAFFFAADLAMGRFASKEDAPFQFLTHLFLVHNLWQATYFGINPSFWSIGVEVQLYAIYPLLLVFQKRLGWEWSLVLALTLEILCNLVPSILGFETQGLRVLSHGPFAYWFSWSLGAYLAQATLEYRVPKWLSIVNPAALLALVLLTWFYRPLTSFSFLSISLLTASLMTTRLSYDPGRTQAGRRSALRFVGMISYSLYLLHQPIISITNMAFSQFIPYTSLPNIAKYCVLFVTSAFLSIMASYIFYLLVERISIDIGNKLALRFSKS